MEKKEMLMEAIAFATRAHNGQMRKDEKTPYISHPFRVCMTLGGIFGVQDEEILAAAVLHDIIEDTTKDFDDIENRFGIKVANWVTTLSKDKRLQEKKREESYFEVLKASPLEVKLIKLADIYDNLSDCSSAAKKEQKTKTMDKTWKYLALFSGEKDKQIVQAVELVRTKLEELS